MAISPAEILTPLRPLDSRNASPQDLTSMGNATPVTGNYFGEDGLNFADMLDMINPLQHIPIVSNLYRAMTGDTLSAGANIIGGALLGGPIGLVASFANIAFEQQTGKDIAGNVMAALTEGSQSPTVLQKNMNAIPASEAALTAALTPIDQHPALTAADLNNPSPGIGRNAAASKHKTQDTKKDTGLEDDATGRFAEALLASRQADDLYQARLASEQYRRAMLLDRGQENALLMGSYLPTTGRF